VKIRNLIIATVLFFVFCFFIAAELESRESRESAWERLLRQNPTAADDPSISWRDRLILYAVTPEQARDYYQGADAKSILLENGETLQQYLDRQSVSTGNLYYPLSGPCPLFSLEGLGYLEPTAVRARGQDLSDQGGSSTGCDIPQDATALMIWLRIDSATAKNRVRVKLWSRSSPEPAEALIEDTNGFSTRFPGMTMIPLSDPDGDPGLELRSSAGAQVTAEIFGYFRPMGLHDSEKVGVGFASEGAQNSFFGNSAGDAITSGTYNSFFGGAAGYETTTGSYNSFFGYNAGFKNNGDRNAFFGDVAGLLNNTGSNNSFFGAGAGHDNTLGSQNAFYGRDAGRKNTTASGNSFFGDEAGFSNTKGFSNSFFGEDAGYSNTEGDDNSFFGQDAGQANTIGSYNSFFGQAAGFSNTEGRRNSFFGESAGALNTIGSDNSFFGENAGYNNIDGNENAFFGSQAGEKNTSGVYNAFFGHNAGNANLTGGYNTFIGRNAGLKNTTGNSNAFVGAHTGWYNSEGFANAFFGTGSGLNNATGNHNTFIGFTAGSLNTIGSENVYIGSRAGYAKQWGSDNTFIGFEAGFSKGMANVICDYTECGSFNVFTGSYAGYSNITGSHNIFTGYKAGNSNVGAIPGICEAGWCGSENVFTGSYAGYENTTGHGNLFFGFHAGFNNTVGYKNNFFGVSAGLMNTAGFNNAFFGTLAGRGNETGSENVFFGHRAGYSNRGENSNSMVGAYADLDPGQDPAKFPVENATAIGYRSYVSQSNSLVLGSIAGINGASDSVKVGIGTTAPSAPLHVSRSDSTTKIILAESTGPEAVRNMMDLKNNGMAQFRLIDTSPNGDAWQFSNTDNNLNISLQGSGSQEFVIENDGDVLINNGTVLVTSYRASKENFAEVDPQEVLDRIAQLPITTWNYRKESKEVRHMGPVSEDFYQAFGLGQDDQHITPNDLAGVNTAAIQGLYGLLQSEMRRKDHRIEELEAELESLKAQFLELRKMVNLTVPAVSSSRE
jgi:hypothetical protein